MGHNGAVVTKKAGHGLGATRARVLRFLVAEHEPRAVAVLADALALHPNTIRFHLEALVSLGYVAEEQDKPHGQRRPRRLYRATPDAPEVDTSHLRNLTQVLIRHIVDSSEQPKKAVEDIGRVRSEEHTSELQSRGHLVFRLLL